MKKTIKIPYKDEAEWLSIRARGIGGSDIGAIMGYNKYKTALDVYRDKILGYKAEENEAMRWGLLLEPVIAEEFARRYNVKLKRKANVVYQSKEHPIFLANVDRIFEENGELGILEVKTTNPYAYRSWQSSIPVSYFLQLQQYLFVLDLDYGYIAILVGGQMMDRIKFVRDEETIKEIIKAGEDFWYNYVEKRIEPEVEKEVIITEDAIEAGLKELEAYNELVDKIQMKKQLEESIEELKTRLKEYMQDKAILVADGTVLARRKLVKRFQFDTKRFSKENEILYNQYLKEIEYEQLTIGGLNND